MIAYSYKDVKIEIDGEAVYCANVDLTYNSSFDPTYLLGERSAFDYRQTSPLEGEVALTYLLTGADPLANFQNEKTPFSVKIGGVTIDAGYLSSYQVSVDPYQSLFADVSLGFYEPIEGDVTNPPEDIAEVSDSIVPLNASDITLGEGTVMKEGSVVDLSYSYSCQIEPVYRIDGGVNISYGIQRVEVSARINDNNFDLLPTGIRENFEINLNDKNQNTVQSFVVNGQIATKGVGTSAGDAKIYTSIQIGQGNLGVLDSKKVVISDFAPKEGDRYTTVSLQGNNFVNVDKILLGEFPCEVSSYTSTSLDFIVARELPSGYKAPIHMITRGMKATSHTGYLVTSGTIY